MGVVEWGVGDGIHFGSNQASVFFGQGGKKEIRFKER